MPLVSSLIFWAKKRIHLMCTCIRKHDLHRPSRTCHHDFMTEYHSLFTGVDHGFAVSYTITKTIIVTISMSTAGNLCLWMNYTRCHLPEVESYVLIGFVFLNWVMNRDDHSYVQNFARRALLQLDFHPLYTRLYKCLNTCGYVLKTHSFSLFLRSEL